MHIGVANVLSYIHEEKLNLFLCPAEYSREHGHGHALDPFFQVRQDERAEFLLLLVARPSVHRPLVLPRHNVDEAGVD